MTERSPRFWGQLHAACLFFQLPSFALTGILPLLGTAIGRNNPTLYQTLQLIGVALAFHIFAYLVNDVIDLTIDRTQTLRSEYPLVKGTVRPGRVFALALLQVPVAVGLTASLGGSTKAYIALGLSFALMTIYNLWGKRTSFPPLTDLTQGVAWGMLIIFGALIAKGSLTTITVSAVAFIVVWTLLINGVHGSLRDLANDYRCGAYTTAIMLGARPYNDHALMVTGRLTAYAYTLHMLMSIVLIVPLAFNWFDYRPIPWMITLLLILLLSVLSWTLFIAAQRTFQDRWSMIFVGVWHMLVTLTSFLALFAFRLNQTLLVSVLAVYIGSLLTADWLFQAVATWLGRGLDCRKPALPSEERETA